MDPQPTVPVSSELPPALPANQAPPMIVHTEPEKPKLNIKLLLGLGLGIVVLLLFLPLGLSAYGVKVPLVSAELQKNLALTAYKLPLLPKTPQQVLFAASSTDKVLTSYTPDFSVSVALSGSTVNAGSFDLKVAGPVDFSNPAEPKFDVKVNVGANIAGTAYAGSGQIRGMGKIVYFKLDEYPENLRGMLSGGLYSLMGSGGTKPSPAEDEEVKKNLEEVLKNWIIYDTSGLDTAARKAMDEQKRNQSLVDGSRASIQEFLSRGSVLPDVKLVGRENLDGTAVYHLKLVPSKNTIKQVITEMMPEEKRKDADTQKAIEAISGHIDSFVAEAWFGTTDALPRKMTVTAQISLGSLMESLMGAKMGTSGSTGSPLGMLPFSDLTAAKVSVSTALLLKDIGKQVTVQVPSPAKNPTDYLQAMQNAAKTTAQKEAEEKKTQIDSDLRDIGMKLGEKYVASGSYPTKLSALTPGQYTEYTYKQKAGGKGYVVYIEFTPAANNFYSAGNSTPTPYYGISSEFSYPHQITQKDLD